MMSKKMKIITLSLGAICLLGIGSYWGNSAYKNYKETKIEQTKEQKEQQHKNGQIEEAKNNISNVVNTKIANLQCEVKYDSSSSTDGVVIKVTLDGKKDATIECNFKLTDDSILFENQDYFKDALDKYTSEELVAEIRHTAIHDYQDMLYGMAGQMSNTWDNVKLSHSDDDYTVQETSDRFFGGDKAYLVIVDSQWIKNNGGSEWKQICLHMEYDKNNKFIDAKYYYADVDPDNDIKNGVKVDNTSTTTSTTKTTSNSKLTADEARQLILNEDGNYISKVTKKDKYNQYSKLETDYEEYSAENMPTKNGWNIPKEPCYEFYVNYYNNKGEALNGVCEYLVGKESKKIYCMPNQGGIPAYQIENNQKVKTFKWIGEGTVSETEWHY